MATRALAGPSLINQRCSIASTPTPMIRVVQAGNAGGAARSTWAASIRHHAPLSSDPHEVTHVLSRRRLVSACHHPCREVTHTGDVSSRGLARLK